MPEAGKSDCKIDGMTGLSPLTGALRPRATVVYLVTRRGYLEQLGESVEKLQRNWLSLFPMPVTIFHTTTIKASAIHERVPGSTQVRVVEIKVSEPPLRASVSDFCDCCCNNRTIRVDKKTGVRGGRYNVGYCNMNRFRTLEMYRHPALRDFDYFVQLDTDMHIEKPMPYDPVAKMADAHAVFGYVKLEIRPDPTLDCNLGMYEAIDKWMARQRLVPVYRPEKGTSYTGNFNIGDLRFLRTDEYYAFSRWINNEATGIYTHRWGDQAFLPNILGAYHPKEKHMHFADLHDNRVAVHRSHSLGRITAATQANKERAPKGGAPMSGKGRKVPSQTSVSTPIGLHWHCGGSSRDRYYASFADALSNHPSVRPCNASRACITVFGHRCTTIASSFAGQVTQLLTGMSTTERGVVVAVFLNKVYKELTRKVEAISRLAADARVSHVAVFSWSPTIGHWPASGSVSYHFLPFAVHMPATTGRMDLATDEYDLYWSGDTNPSKYMLRRELVDIFPQLAQEHGVRIHRPEQRLADLAYEKALAASRLVLSTPLREWHLVGTRYFEVMATGRAILLCYREPRAYEPLGIVEDKHAIMFGSRDEFVEKLLRYANASGSVKTSAARLKMAKRARALVAQRHTWRHRAAFVVEVLAEAGNAFTG